MNFLVESGLGLKRNTLDLKINNNWASVGAEIKSKLEKAQEFAKKLGYLAEDFVQLALQDSLNRVGIDMEVSVTSPAPRKKRRKKPTGSTTSAR